MRGKTKRSTFLVAAGCATWFSLAPPQEEERLRFENGLREAHGLLAARKYEAVRSRLLEIVGQHEEREYVRYHWFEIEDLLAEASFWKGYRRPAPAQAVHGELLSWDESSGNIRLRYRSEDRQLDPPSEEREESSSDFFGSEDLFLHPILFKGPYQIELEGDELRGDLPLVLVGWDWGSMRGLDHGHAQLVRFGDAMTVYELSEGRPRALDSSSTMIKFQRPYSFKVSVSKSTLSVFYNGKLQLKTERAGGEFGQFGFTSLKGLDEVTISGKIEPSWITGRVDERVQADIQRFRQDFDPLALLPDWLRKGVLGSDRRAAEFGERLPEPLGPQDRSELDKVQELLKEDKLQPALTHSQALEAPRVSPACKSWILAHLLLYQGRLSQALEHCEEVCASHPGFYEARLLRARLYSSAGDRARAVRELEQLAIDLPEYVDTYEALVLINLVDGRRDEARLAIEAGVDNGVSPRALARAGRTVLRTENGPAWGERFSYETQNYAVLSNLSREACAEIGRELEEFHRKYAIHLRRPSAKQEEKARVYFFSGAAGYHTYTGELLGDPAENTLGLYSPWLKQLVIWNSPDKRMVLRTVRHEGFHQYLDRITGEAPVWLNEGMAEYFEQSRLVNGSWKDDQTNPDHLALLRRTRKEWTPLRDFVHQDNAGFRVRSGLHYAQAWALIHFLTNGPNDQGKRLETLLDALQEGASRETALERAFAQTDWDELEREFRAYVEELE